MTQKQRTVLVAVISSILSILIFSIITYNSYSFMRYKACLNDQTGLVLLDKGYLVLMDEEELDDKIIESYIGEGIELTREKGTGNLRVKYIEEGYTKYYQNYVLTQLRVDDRLAEFISYLNPVGWFSGIRSYKSDKVYDINRYGSEYVDIQQLIHQEEWELLREHYTVISVGDKFFIE